MTAPELALLVEGFTQERGGAERAIHRLALSLAADGHDVSVYAPDSRAGPELPAPGRRVAVRVASGPRPLWAVEAARALGRAAREDGARRVVACGKLWGADAYWPHAGVQRAARRASQAAKAGSGRQLLGRLGRALRPSEWAYDLIEGRALSACRRGEARAIALSNRVRQDMMKHHGLRAEQVVVLPNGVDPQRFSPADEDTRGEARRALAARVGARGDSAIALFCAHAFRLKGLETLLRAAGDVPGVHVVVAGAGSPRPWLELAQGMRLSGRLTFLGAVSDMQPVFRGATCLVHPSQYDPCSLVVLEALACGLPVIGSAADGASELVVEGQSGFVVSDPRDAAAYAERLHRLCDPKLRRVLSEGAATFRRSWSDVGRELLELVA